MQQQLLFTPAGSDDPMSLAFPDYANIHGVYVPAPTTTLLFQIPNANTWLTVYEITQLSAETIPFDEIGYGQLRVTSNGVSGNPFWIIVMTQFVSPWKAQVA